MFKAAIDLASDAFEPVPTRAHEPARLIDTSRTTGNPKGALHAHCVLLGHLSGVELSHDFLPQLGDFYRTPADWAWIGGLLDGLLDVLLPAWHHGVPALAHPISKFDPAFALRLTAEYGVRNAQGTAKHRCSQPCCILSAVEFVNGPAEALLSKT